MTFLILKDGNPHNLLRERYVFLCLLFLFSINSFSQEAFLFDSTEAGNSSLAFTNCSEEPVELDTYKLFEIAKNNPNVNQAFYRKTGLSVQEVLAAYHPKRNITKGDIESLIAVKLASGFQGKIQETIANKYSCLSDPTLSLPQSDSPINTSLLNLTNINQEERDRCTFCTDISIGDDDPNVRDRYRDIRNVGRRRDRTDWSTIGKIPENYMTTLVPSTNLNYNHPEFGNEIKHIHDKLRNESEIHKRDPIRAQARYAAANLLAGANSYVGQPDVAREFLRMAEEMANFSIGQGNACNVQDIFRSIAGYDPFTGDALDEDQVATASLVFLQQLLQRYGPRLARTSLAQWISRTVTKYGNRAYRLAQRGIDKALKLADKLKFWNRGRVDLPLNHIMRGEFTNGGKLRKGLHSLSQMQKYLRNNPDIARRTVITRNNFNGVVHHKLPKDAYYRGVGFANGKTTFPSSWDATKITDAVNKLLKLENINVPDVVRTIERTRVIDGVRMRVVVANGRIVTTFPEWPQ
jgi:hypothetical protein